MAGIRDAVNREMARADVAEETLSLYSEPRERARRIVQTLARGLITEDEAVIMLAAVAGYEVPGPGDSVRREA